MNNTAQQGASNIGGPLHVTGISRKPQQIIRKTGDKELTKCEIYLFRKPFKEPVHLAC
jgi:hypothetical protein